MRPKPSRRARRAASVAAAVPWLADEVVSSPKAACGPTYSGRKCQPFPACRLSQRRGPYRTRQVGAGQDPVDHLRPGAERGGDAHLLGDDRDPPCHLVFDRNWCRAAGGGCDEHCLGGPDKQTRAFLIKWGSAHVDRVAVEADT